MKAPMAMVAVLLMSGCSSPEAQKTPPVLMSPAAETPSAELQDAGPGNVSPRDEWIRRLNSEDASARRAALEEIFADIEVARQRSVQERIASMMSLEHDAFRTTAALEGVTRIVENNASPELSNATGTTHERYPG
jgi:hypothetical protein